MGVPPIPAVPVGAVVGLGAGVPVALAAASPSSQHSDRDRDADEGVFALPVFASLPLLQNPLHSFLPRIALKV